MRKVCVSTKRVLTFDKNIMKHLSNTTRFGVYSAISIGAFFTLIYSLGFGHIQELRLFNLVIVVYFTNRLLKSNLAKSNHLSYLENLGSAFLANLICVILSLIGLVVFINFIDANYFQSANADSMWSQADSLGDLMLILFLEGMSSAAIISFSLMQYWKNDIRLHKTIYKSS